MGNLLLRTDSYKLTHWPQYPPDTRFVYSYLESRGGMFDSTLFFGLQYYLKKYLAGKAFNREDILEAEVFAKKHFGAELFNTKGWTRMFEKYHGYLPIRIRAVKEGSVVQTHNVLMTVENTDPEFYWLTNYLETLLLKVWYPTTVATLSRAIKQVIGKALDRTGDPSLLPFKLHDFGDRGVSSEETAAIGGAAHLLNFRGTDTLEGIQMLREFYFADMPGFSIPASEHSTMTAWGEDHEVDAYRNMLTTYPNGLVACVSDSYDIDNAVSKLWGETLRDEVMGRNGVLVIRPDSGNPVDVLRRVFEQLEEKFGLDQEATSKKGYKVLAPCVRVIQGDGVNYHTIQNMVSILTREGWSMDNFGFGMGGALLQQLNRDTQKFAFKCSAVNVGGEWRDVYKNPKTDPGKASKRGCLALLRDTNNEFHTVRRAANCETPFDELEVVFENGKILREEDFETIRMRTNSF